MRSRNIAILAVVLAVLILAGFFFFSGGPERIEEDLGATITDDQSGEPAD